MKDKICTKCNVPKELKEFHNLRTGAQGKKPICKECSYIEDIQYKRTKKGLITKIYGNQRSNSRKRGHVLPNYTATQLYEWAITQESFRTLYITWVGSNYSTNLVPSCDRIRDDLPYTLSNLILMAWEDNDKKGHETSKQSDQCKAIIGTNIKTKKVLHFASINAASRKGFHSSHISYCCKGKSKTHKGYTWQYAITKDKL